MVAQVVSGAVLPARVAVQEQLSEMLSETRQLGERLAGLQPKPRRQPVEQAPARVSQPVERWWRAREVLD